MSNADDNEVTPPPHRHAGLDMQFLREFKRELVNRFEALGELVTSIGDRVGAAEQASAVERYKLTQALQQVYDLEKTVETNGKRISELESSGKMHWAVKLLIGTIALAVAQMISDGLLKPWASAGHAKHNEASP